MDRKSLLILLVSFVLLTLWYPLVNRFFPPKPAPKTAFTNGLGTNFLASATNPATKLLKTNDALPAASLSAVNVPPPSLREEELTLENGDVRYIFTSFGGGLKLVELKNYPAAVSCRDRTIATSLTATLNSKAQLPAFMLVGSESLQGDNLFALYKTNNLVRAEKLLPGGLHLIKEFGLSTNYLLKVVTRLENRSNQPIKVPTQEWTIGTATPMTLHDESLTLGLQWFNGVKPEKIGETYFANRTLGCFPGNPRTEYIAGASNVVWASVANQFFAIATLPAFPAYQVISRRIDLPSPSSAEKAKDSKVSMKPFGYQTALVYPEVILGPNQGLERRFDAYTGPKEYKILARLGHELDAIMEFDGFSGFFAKPLLLSMNALHSRGLPYGLAIILITILIKTIFWPLTTASTRSMKRMSALQPQMKAIQEKYKEDPKKMNLKVMEFMKENKVSPLGGCLPMLLQIPVFFGFYRMLQSAIELRGASFLWACDLSQADTVYVIPGIDFPINPFPLMMGVTMLWQASMTPPSPGMDPVQQKMMKYMPLMLMVFFYNSSAGLTLYWTVQNLLTITQMKLTRDKGPAGASGAKVPVRPLPIKKK
jgi:YidC/Oxa1 family membrane protein insertase